MGFSGFDGEDESGGALLPAAAGAGARESSSCARFHGDITNTKGGA